MLIYSIKKHVARRLLLIRIIYSKVINFHAQKFLDRTYKRVKFGIQWMNDGSSSVLKLYIQQVYIGKNSKSNGQHFLCILTVG